MILISYDYIYTSLYSACLYFTLSNQKNIHKRIFLSFIFFSLGLKAHNDEETNSVRLCKTQCDQQNISLIASLTFLIACRLPYHYFVTIVTDYYSKRADFSTTSRRHNLQ